MFWTCCSVEVSAGQFAYSLLTEGRGVRPEVAALVVGGYWAALTLGRVIFGQLAARWPRDTILQIGTFGAPVGLVLFGWDTSDWVSFGGPWLLGFALALIFPMMVLVTPHRLGRAHGPNAVGLQMSAASLSIATLPGLGAVLMRQAGPETLVPYMLVPVGCVLALQELAVRLARRPSTEA